jgi:hypothetical protein
MVEEEGEEEDLWRSNGGVYCMGSVGERKRENWIAVGMEKRK